MIFAVAVAFLQFFGYRIGLLRNISFFDYSNWLVFGFLMGFGALMGDLVKSFFKRRVGIEPGCKFVPFDQIDFVFGSLAFIMPVFDLTLKIFITSLAISFVLHIIVNHTSFYLKIRNEKW